MSNFLVFKYKSYSSNQTEEILINPKTISSAYSISKGVTKIHLTSGYTIDAELSFEALKEILKEIKT